MLAVIFFTKIAIISIFDYWTLNVSWTVAYEITLIDLSICLSGCLSLGFLKIWSLVVSDNVHDDNWPWYLVTDEARFFKTNVSSPNLGLMGQKKKEIEYSDSFQQCITPRGKTFKKKIWSKTGQNQAQN